MNIFTATLNYKYRDNIYEAIGKKLMQSKEIPLLIYPMCNPNKEVNLNTLQVLILNKATHLLNIILNKAITQDTSGLLY